MKMPESGQTADKTLYLKYEGGVTLNDLVPSDEPPVRGSVLVFEGQQVDDAMIASYERAAANAKRKGEERGRGRARRTAAEKPAGPAAGPAGDPKA